MSFVKNFTTIMLSLGYTYNATIDKIEASNIDLSDKVSDSINAFVDLLKSGDITGHVYYTKALSASNIYESMNVNIGNKIVDEIGFLNVAVSDIDFINTPTLEFNSYRILQGWAYAVYTKTLSFQIYQAGGFSHISQLTADELLTAFGFDVSAMDSSANTGYAEFIAVWEYLRSQPNFYGTEQVWILDENTRVDFYDRPRPSIGLFYPVGSGTPGTIDLQYGTTSVTVGVYENEYVEGYTIGTDGTNNFVTYNAEGEPVSSQFLNWRYSVNSETGLKQITYPTQNHDKFNEIGSTIEVPSSRTSTNPSEMLLWIANAPVKNSFIEVGYSVANMEQHTGDANTNGTWDVITSSNIVDDSGNIRGEYTFTVPRDISDILSGTNNGEILIENALLEIGCVAVNTQTKTDISSGLTYGQIVDKIQSTPSDRPESPSVPTTQANSTGMFGMFNPTRSQVQQLGEFLWSSNVDDTVKKMLVDPMDIIISLSMVPVDPITGGEQEIKMAYVPTGVSAKRIESQYVSKNLGSIYIGGLFDNFLDFNPFTEVHLFLPFVGVVQLDADIVMNSTLNVTYNIDLLSGAFSCNINVQNGRMNAVMFTYGGTMSQALPLTGANYGQIYGSLLSGIGSVVGAVATGGASALAGAVAGAAVSTASSVLSNKLQISQSGGAGGVTGFLSGFEAYAIIKRPVPYESGNYGKFMGKPCANIRVLSGLTGYTVAENALLNIPNATEAELTEIRDLLASGVYL